MPEINLLPYFQRMQTIAGAGNAITTDHVRAVIREVEGRATWNSATDGFDTQAGCELAILLRGDNLTRLAGLYGRTDVFNGADIDSLRLATAGQTTISVNILIAELTRLGAAGDRIAPPAFTPRPPARDNGEAFSAGSLTLGRTIGSDGTVDNSIAPYLTTVARPPAVAEYFAPSGTNSHTTINTNLPGTGRHATDLGTLRLNRGMVADFLLGQDGRLHVVIRSTESNTVHVQVIRISTGQLLDFAERNRVALSIAGFTPTSHYINADQRNKITIGENHRPDENTQKLLRFLVRDVLNSTLTLDNFQRIFDTPDTTNVTYGSGPTVREAASTQATGGGTNNTEDAMAAATERWTSKNPGLAINTTYYGVRGAPYLLPALGRPFRWIGGRWLPASWVSAAPVAAAPAAVTTQATFASRWASAGGWSRAGLLAKASPRFIPVAGNLITAGMTVYNYREALMMPTGMDANGNITNRVAYEARENAIGNQNFMIACMVVGACFGPVGFFIGALVGSILPEIPVIGSIATGIGRGITAIGRGIGGLFRGIGRLFG